MATRQQQLKGPLSSLPRSVIWRLRLELLKELPADSAQTKQLTLEDVVRHNAKLIQEEQDQYAKLQASYGDHFSNSDNQQNEEEEVELEDELPGSSQDASQDLVEPSTSEATTLDPLTAALDPLTAMLQEQQAQEDRRQELDLRYRKERARRKRGLATEAKVVVADCDDGEVAKKLDADTLNVIDKDLHRLPSPQISDFEGVSINWETEEQQEAWILALREILYIYGQEHPYIGYRQGMHEVASYLWMALEIDRKIIQQKAISSASDVQTPLQEQSTLLFGRAAAYSMLRSILGNIRQAFDVKVASNSRPLEDMSHSILAKIKQSHNYYGMQDQLTPMLLSLSVPPQLYCTKWIRLLFSREVIGAQNVIMLWDVFIELVAEGWEWMAVLETTAASRILLCRDQLLDTSMPDYSPAAHHHRAMDLLMNMPPMDDIEPVVGRLNGLLELQKYTQCMHQEVAKQDEASHKNTLYPNDHSGQQHIMSHQQQYHQHDAAFPSFGGDISSVFSLKSIRQSLEQGAQQLSSNSDTWKKRLVEEWNGLQQQPMAQQDFRQPLSTSPSQRSYMMDTSLFGEEEEMQQQQKQRPEHVPAGYPRPVAASMNAKHPHHGMNQQRSQESQRKKHSQTVLNPAMGAPLNSSKVQNPLMGPNGVATSTALPSAGQATLPTLAASHSANHSNALAPQTAAQLPHELAFRLGNSVTVLQEFVMSVARPNNNQNQYPNLQFQNGDAAAGVPVKVPNTVWEALAEVEAVRNVLLQQGSGL